MKIEMHVHISEGSSCAKAEAQEIVKAYGEAGYDAIFITNHFDPRLLHELGRRMSRRSNGICLVTVRRGKPENDMELK